MVKEMLKNNGALNTLIGFENSQLNGKGIRFNVIMSNGSRSTQKDTANRCHDQIIPADALQKIRSVNIHYDIRITAFSFFDKDGLRICEIGDTK